MMWSNREKSRSNTDWRMGRMGEQNTGSKKKEWAVFKVKKWISCSQFNSNGEHKTSKIIVSHLKILFCLGLFFWMLKCVTEMLPSSFALTGFLPVGLAMQFECTSFPLHGLEGWPSGVSQKTWLGSTVGNDLHLYVCMGMMNGCLHLP